MVAGLLHLRMASVSSCVAFRIVFMNAKNSSMFVSGLVFWMVPELAVLFLRIVSINAKISFMFVGVPVFCVVPVVAMLSLSRSMVRGRSEMRLRLLLEHTAVGVDMFAIVGCEKWGV